MKKVLKAKIFSDKITVNSIVNKICSSNSREKNKCNWEYSKHVKFCKFSKVLRVEFDRKKHILQKIVFLKQIFLLL